MNNKLNIAWIILTNLIFLVVLILLVTTYTFRDPLWLWCLLIIPLLSIYLSKKEDSYFGELNISEVESVPSQNLLQYIPNVFSFTTLLALFFGLLALARPQQEMVPENITKEGIDIIIALDVSLSMLAKDFDPNRLEVAKEVAKEFVMERRNDRIGIVTYAAESFPRVPLTTDLSMVVNAIDKIKYGELIDGTAIGMGLASSVNRLKDSESKSKAVILLSDGANNRGKIEPDVASELAKAYGVTVYTIGIGSEGTALSPVPDYFGNVTYREISVSIDEQTLYDIAQNTGGEYFRATNKQELENIYKEVDQLEKTRFESTIIKQKIGRAHV